MDVRGLRRDGRQHDFRRRHREVLAVVLSDAEEFQPDLIGQDGLGDDIPQCLRMRVRLAGLIEGDVAEGVEPEFNRVRGHLPSVQCRVLSALPRGRRRLVTRTCAVTCALLLGGAAAVHTQQKPAIDILKVHGQVYLLAGPAGNTLIQVGAQGVLVVDTQRDQDAGDVLDGDQAESPATSPSVWSSTRTRIRITRAGT